MFVVSLLLAFSMMGQIESTDQGMFEMDIDPRLGVLGCTKLCEERRARVDVKYSPITIACRLLFNFSGNQMRGQGPGEPCRMGVHRSVSTRSGSLVEVLEKCYGNEDTDSSIYTETKLTFHPRHNYRMCKGRGKPNNFIEPEPEANIYQQCSSYSVQLFENDMKYSWVMHIIFHENAVSNIRLRCTGYAKRNPIHIAFSLHFKKSEFGYKLKANFGTLNISTSHPFLKFFLQRSDENVLNIVDLKDNITITTIKSSNQHGCLKFRLYVKCYGMKLIFD